MNLTQPTVSEIRDSIVTSIEGEVNTEIPALQKTFTRVFATACAGAMALLYKYGGASLLQQFVRYASDRATTVNGQDVTPLSELGVLFGVGSPGAATRAEFELTLDVTQTLGTLPAGSQFLRTETGVVYVTLASVALVSPSVTVSVRAAGDQEDTGGEGAIGNLLVDDEVQAVSPPANLTPTAVVSAVLVTAADGETTSAYRQRILEATQARPQGGAYADYRVWARSVAGIVAAYPYAGDPSEVLVYVEATAASSGSADGIPTAGQLTEVAGAIGLDVDGKATRRPVGAAVTVLAISRLAFDVDVNGLAGDAVVDATAAIETALDEYFRAREPFIVGLSVFPRRDRITLAAVSGVVDDTASSFGVSVASVELELSGSPITAYTLDQGEKAKAGVVTTS